jgi:hypothetical protein
MTPKYIFWNPRTGESITEELDDDWHAAGMASSLEDEWGVDSVDWDHYEHRCTELENE